MLGPNPDSYSTIYRRSSQHNSHRITHKGSLADLTLSVSAYVTPSILSGGRQNVTSMLIFQQYGAILNFQFGAALSVVLLVTALILVGVYLIALDRGRRPA